MARRLRPLTPEALEQVLTGCRACAFWESAERLEVRCGAACDPDRVREWFDTVSSEWGECGRAVFQDDEVLGFVKYAPSGYFPQAAHFAAAPLDPSVPLVACLHIRPDARQRGLGRVLLQAALKDLALRKHRQVEAFACASPTGSLEDTPMLGMPFLLRHGFTVSRPNPAYPLLQLELRSLAILTENLENVLESLRLPRRVPAQAPVPWT